MLSLLGPRFSPWLGTKILQAALCSQKNKQKKVDEVVHMECLSRWLVLHKCKASLLSSCLSLINLENGSMGGLNEILCKSLVHACHLWWVLFHRCTTYLSSMITVWWCSGWAGALASFPRSSYRIGRTQCEMKVLGPLVISLVVQWLRLCASNAGGTSSIPGQGTRSPHATVTK